MGRHKSIEGFGLPEQQSGPEPDATMLKELSHVVIALTIDEGEEQDVSADRP